MAARAAGSAAAAREAAAREVGSAAAATEAAAREAARAEEATEVAVSSHAGKSHCSSWRKFALTESAFAS